MAARDSLRVSVHFARHQPRQIGGRAEGPLVADMGEIDATAGVIRLQVQQRRLDVDALGQTLGQRRLVERRRGGKQQRFQQAQRLRARGGLRPALRSVSSTATRRFSARLGMVSSPSNLLRPVIAYGALCLGGTLANVERRERFFLINLGVTFTHEFERCGKARRENGRHL